MSTFTPEAPAQTPIADLAVDENVLSLLITLDDPTCEYGSLSDVIPTCGKRAEWLMVISCGCSAYDCDEHRRRLQKTLDASSSLGCERHGGVTVTVEWRRVL